MQEQLQDAQTTQRQVFEKTLGVWSGAFILALDTTKAPDGATSSHVLTAYGWQTIDLYEQNDGTCQFGRNTSSKECLMWLRRVRKKHGRKSCKIVGW